MFWARIEALIPMHMLFSEEYFEKEYGQVDGTFAHAFERMFSISSASLNLDVANCELNRYASLLPKQNYSFASRG
jgi:lipopolysaccharide biosynthesis protein